VQPRVTACITKRPATARSPWNR